MFLGNYCGTLSYGVVVWCFVCVCFTETFEVTNFISFCLWYINFFNKPITQIGNIKKSWCFCVDLVWVTHSSILAWRIPGTEEPGGLLSMGLHRVRHDWNNLAAAAAALKKKKKRLRFAFKNFTEKSWPRVESRDLRYVTRTNGAHLFQLFSVTSPW